MPSGSVVLCACAVDGVALTERSDEGRTTRPGPQFQKKGLIRTAETACLKAGETGGGLRAPLKP